MASPLPSDFKPLPLEHAYQSSDTLSAALSCHCGGDKLMETIKTERDCVDRMSPVSMQYQHAPTLPHQHHHQQHYQHASSGAVASTGHAHSHSISQVHVHVHHAPAQPQPKTMANCTCRHLQNAGDQDGGGAHQDQERKIEADDRIEISPLPPALPPRPPPRPRYDGSIGRRYRQRDASPGGGRIRKYVFWCCACGGLATILGALFLAVYFLLRSYTSTLGYFETIPTFVPATMLILTGLCVMSLARRKNRYSYLLKVCGVCCLVCALTCVLVTITTTVIHMNRLQTLRECVYTQKTRTCTCYSVLLEAHPQTDEGMRFVFDSTPDCEVIHGALYTCLRAMFGLSVSGILVCIFSCMLVYQLLSHERKKMYWEQLELRCRSFYQQHGAPPTSAPGSMRGPPMPAPTYCSCCDECRYPQIVPAPPQMYPWDNGERFWTPGRVGNFYSPNPGEDLPNESRIASGWNWRRLPWTRNPAQDSPRDNSLTYQGIASSADSQYGFTNRDDGNPVSSTGSYSVLDRNPPGVYIWGPPPPYSNPNSPARRGMHASPARYHHMHPPHHHHAHENHCQMNEESLRNLQDFQREIRERRSRHKDNYENTGEVEYHQHEGNDHTDTSSNGERISHTLPVRKVKKRMDMSSMKNVTPTPACRINVKSVFQEETPKDEEHKYHEPNLPALQASEAKEDNCRFLPRLQGVENAAFQKQEASPQKPEPTESEMYFADVSSCCNISVRNDGPDSSLYDEATEKSATHPTNQEQEAHERPLESYTSSSSAGGVAHAIRLSTRSRLPLPLPIESSSQGIPKDISSNSLASSVQTPMTETTDDCVTPTTDCCTADYDEESFLAPDAQYEVIQEQGQVYRPSPGTSSNLTTTISGLTYAQNYFAPQMGGQQRRNVSISNLMKNLGTNPAGLLYNEAHSGGEEDRRGQSSHSDVTIDSGWQSGSEKPEQLEIHKPVNV